jgi:hypothetical protein
LSNKNASALHRQLLLLAAGCLLIVAGCLLSAACCLLRIKGLQFYLRQLFANLLGCL